MTAGPPGARALGPAVLLLAATAGLSWAPTFPLRALALPVLLPLAAVLVVDQLCRGRAAALRPVLGLVLGAGVLVLAFRLVDGAGAAEVLRGVTGGWRRTLGSTLPALPDTDLVAFVPALALLAGVLGIEWGRRGAGPAGTLLPGLAVVVPGQLFRAATGTAALLTAAAVGGAAVVVLLADRSVGSVRGHRGIVGVAPYLTGTLAVATLAAWGATTVAVPGRATLTLQNGRTADSPPLSAADPLAQVAALLTAGERPAFTARAGAPVDRWPLVVLDRFDGVTWSSGARLLRLGAELTPPAVTVPVEPAQAEIADVRLDGPWLPSQERLRRADGIRPLVDPATGVLVHAPDAATGRTVPYVLHWERIRIGATELTSSAIDPEPVGAVELAGVPAGISALARQAVGPDTAPTVQAALVLEKWMQQNYQVATGVDLPTGHSTAQLLHFLTTARRGTSEQFAPAYALMARSLGIPVRVVVGFRDDGSGAVHDGDVLAWPEVAVRGVGWVPLDPTGGARSSTARGDDLAGATQAARRNLPSADQLAPRQPDEPPPVAAPVVAGPGALPLWPVGAAALVAVVAVPVTKRARRVRRRRSPPHAAVVNAWRDTRDVLGDHGVAVPTGSTVRELAAVAPVEAADVDALAQCVDDALWAGHEPDRALADQAWAAADRMRRALRTQPWSRRVRAAFSVGSLRTTRQQRAPRTG